MALTITDMDMELRITDINKLEEEVEYYVIFCLRPMYMYNGIYTLFDTSINTYNRVGILVNNNNIAFDLYYETSLMVMYNFGIVINGCFNNCWLFKMPTNEYVLK